MSNFSDCRDSVATSSTPTGRLVLNLLRAFEKELLQRLENVGVDDLSFAEINLLRQIPKAGIRSTQLALESSVSKQAVTKTMSALHDKGYVEVKDDPSDARARLVTFSPRGHKLLKNSLETIRDIEESYRRCLGTKRHEELRSDLHALLQLHAGWSGGNG